MASVGFGIKIVFDCVNSKRPPSAFSTPIWHADGLLADTPLAGGLEPMLGELRF